MTHDRQPWVHLGWASLGCILDHRLTDFHIFLHSPILKIAPQYLIAQTSTTTSANKLGTILLSNMNNLFNPRCLYCSGPTKERRCSPSNANGNAHRPYYTCSSCGKFACFGDGRGVLEENPTCSCEDGRQLSRRVIAGRKTRYPRSISYQCATGRCPFFAYKTNIHGQILLYNGPLSPRYLESMGF